MNAVAIERPRVRVRVRVNAGDDLASELVQPYIAVYLATIYRR